MKTIKAWAKEQNLNDSLPFVCQRFVTDSEDVPVTVVIGEGTEHPAIMTQEEHEAKMRAMVEELRSKMAGMRDFASAHFTPSAADRTCADLKSVDIHIQAIAAKHNIHL